MTDHYDEMKVSPDLSQAEALRQRLHARVASVSRDHPYGRSDLRLDTARLDPDELVPTKEITVSLDANTNEPRNRRRMALAAAAVVAVIGLTGVAFAINNSSSDDVETPSPTAVANVAPTTSVAPTTTAEPTMETVHLNVANGIPVTLTAPDDWNVDADWTVYKSGIGSVGLIFDEVGDIYADGCKWGLVDPPPGPTVDDLASAWTNVTELAATAPIDVTVDGFNGKQFELTVPDYEPNECRGISPGQFGLYQLPSETGVAPGYWAMGPNHHLQMWVLDVDGTRLVIGAGTFPSSTPQDRAVLEEVLASIQIG